MESVGIISVHPKGVFKYYQGLCVTILLSASHVYIKEANRFIHCVLKSGSFHKESCSFYLLTQTVHHYIQRTSKWSGMSSHCTKSVRRQEAQKSSPTHVQPPGRQFSKAVQEALEGIERLSSSDLERLRDSMGKMGLNWLPKMKRIAESVCHGELQRECCVETPHVGYIVGSVWLTRKGARRLSLRWEAMVLSGWFYAAWCTSFCKNDKQTCFFHTKPSSQ